MNNRQALFLLIRHVQSERVLALSSYSVPYCARSFALYVRDNVRIRDRIQRASFGQGGELNCFRCLLDLDEGIGGVMRVMDREETFNLAVAMSATQ
jgi:hypothetical protein